MADNASNIFETALLGLIFTATSIAGLAENVTTAPITSFSVQLHTASPTDTGDLTASEATYTGYTRMPVLRTTAGFTVAGSSSVTGSVIFSTPVSFPQCSGATTNLITHFSLGNSTVAGSTGIMYVYGTVTPNISVSNGVTPRLTSATQITII